MEGAATLASIQCALFARLRRVSGRKLVLPLLAIGLAGFGLAYLPATGSSAPPPTTIPTPDPYPTPVRSVPPPPPPATTYIPAPPPPPPTTVSAPAPPPPPPPVARVRPKPLRHTRPSRPEPKAFAAWHVRGVVAQRSAEGLTRSQLVAATAPAALAATTNEVRVPAGILLLIPVAFVFLLLIVTLVVLPVRVLPAPAAAALDGRREHLVFVALCALSFGFVLVLLVVLASS